MQKTLLHYIENTGDKDLIFLEMFKSSLYQEFSFSEWLVHTPSELVIAHLKIDEAMEREQIESVRARKASRDITNVERRLKQLAEACRNGHNVMPVLVDAVKDYVSLGEVSDVYRQVFGLYREPIIF